MAGLKITFLGSGDAFGSGGRLQACMHVDTGENSFLIDCGATAMIGIRKFGIDPNEISTIYISHMHGDHFAGISFFVLDAQLVSKRTQPLTIFVPTGAKAHLITAMNTLFPGSYDSPKKFAVEIIEMDAEKEYRKNDVAVISYKVNHSGLDARALRFSVKNKIIAYSGDTQWEENLVKCALEADVFIAEAYYYDRKVKFHLDLESIKDNMQRIRAKKYILTHMSGNMLDDVKSGADGFELAADGKIVEI